MNRYLIIFVLISEIYVISQTTAQGVVIPDSASKLDSAIDPSKSLDNQILIVVSYDGFRNEYLQRNVTPNLLEFQSKGVHSDYMMNVFPTKTFTNHHSISTGVYPESHGVLANALFDKRKGELKYGYDLFHYNDSVLPIWTVNELSGGVSGCMMWPGSDFAYKGIPCSYMKKYDSKMNLNQRVDSVMTWLTSQEKPANLIMFYSEMPDKLAHVVGPNSDNITRIVENLDEITKYIQDQLAIHNLTHRANVIHLSDHGMAGVNPPNFINLTQIVAPLQFDYYGTSPVLQIVPKNLSQTDDILKKLEESSLANGTFKAFNNNTVLKRWHMHNAQRFGPIIVVANEGYAFDDMWIAANEYKKKFNISVTSSSEYGIHGYDNNEKLMHAIFMAQGPIFKESTKIDPFETVDLFGLFSKILQINSTKVAINLEKLNEKSYGAYEISIGIIILLVILCIVIASVMIYFLLKVMKRRSHYIL